MEHLKNDKDKVFGKKKHFDYVPVSHFLCRFIKWSIKRNRASKK